MELQTIQISDIKRDEDQPRKFFDEEALQRLAESIKNDGLETPIVVRQNGSGYIIIDGERRWRASKKAGIKEMPCIISRKEGILEQQLRSDCLKEGLTVDELDKAIYNYYEGIKDSFITSYKTGRPSKNELSHDLQVHIGKAIGKSYTRVSKAIDRFEFKRENKSFVDEIEKKHNPGNKQFGKVNSTIAFTDKLKSTPEVRKAVIEKILDTRQKEKFGSNDRIKNQIDIIARKGITDPKDAVAIMKDSELRSQPEKILKSDPRFLFQKQYFEFNKYADSFYDFEFDTVKDYLKGSELLKNFIKEVDDLKNYLKSLEK